MTGKQLIANQVTYQFGDFVQATQLPRATTAKNGMDKQTSDAIYCFPLGNSQDRFWVYKIGTNQVVHCSKAAFKLSHVSDVIIRQINAISSNKSTPEGLIFGNRDNNKTIHNIHEDVPDFDYDFYDIYTLSQSSKFINTCLCPSPSNLGVRMFDQVPIHHPFVEFLVPNRACC